MGREKYYRATRRLDIRSGPGDDYDLWERYEKGEEVVAPVTEGWIPVLLEDETGGDITGWVNAKCLEEAPDLKPEPPVEGPESTFPIFQKNLKRTFGTPSYNVSFKQKNIINIDLSEFADSLSHVKTLDGKKLTSTVGHRLLEKPLKKAPGLVCDRGLAKEIKTFDGIWAVRPMKSSNSYSVHSWGLAIDFNAQTSPFQTPGSATWPDMVTDFSLVNGFKTGAFTGKKITDYINAERTDFINARRCINRLDKAEKIAAIAEQFLEV